MNFYFKTLSLIQHHCVDNLRLKNTLKSQNNE